MSQAYSVAQAGLKHGLLLSLTGGCKLEPQVLSVVVVFNLKFVFIYMGVLAACVCVPLVCLLSVEGIGSPGTGITNV